MFIAKKLMFVLILVAVFCVSVDAMADYKLLWDAILGRDPTPRLEKEAEEEVKRTENAAFGNEKSVPKSAKITGGVPVFGDKETRVFHIPECRLKEGLPNDNFEQIASAEDALERGYKGCSECIASVEEKKNPNEAEPSNTTSTTVVQEESVVIIKEPKHVYVDDEDMCHRPCCKKIVGIEKSTMKRFESLEQALQADNKKCDSCMTSE